jgi:hypothetical protein
MSATITYDPINQGEYYTIVQMNALFAALAVVINNKLDQAEQQTSNVVTSEGTNVVVTDASIDSQDPTMQVIVTKNAILSSDLTVNGQEILNAGIGVHAGDSVNVLQALQILGLVGQ